MDMINSIISSQKKTNSETIDKLTSITKDLESRNEIQDIIHWMIHDIETTKRLQEEKQNESIITKLERKVEKLTEDLSEYHAIEQSNVNERLGLGDKFISELFILSLKLHDLELWKEQHCEKIELYDELTRKNNRLEEIIRSMKRTASLNMNAMRDPTADKMVLDDSTLEKDLGSNIEVHTELQKPLQLEQAPVSQTLDQALVVSSTANDDNVNNMEDKEEDTSPLTLEKLEGGLLLEIFSFLDPMDVFQLANVNESFYTKIDTLFNPGSDNDQDASATTDTTEKQPVIPSPPKKQEAKPPQQHVDIGPTVVKIPPLSPQKPTPSSVSAFTSGAAPLVNQMFARFQQPKKDQPIAPKTTTVKSLTTTSEAPVLNTAMANSMADKLSPSELAVIISMTEKLRQKDAKLTSLQTQVDDLSARLDGTESVKNFLITKLRDTELELQNSHQKTLKLSQQTTSDQEVITFLDSKVLSLESSYQSLQFTHKSFMQQKDQIIQNTKEKQKVMEDLLSFERQQLQDLEKEYSKTKKLLVKEVKHCRKQIVAMQAERDSFYQQNLLLKKALMSEERDGALKALDDF